MLEAAVSKQRGFYRGDVIVIHTQEDAMAQPGGRVEEVPVVEVKRCCAPAQHSN